MFLGLVMFIYLVMLVVGLLIYLVYLFFGLVWIWLYLIVGLFMGVIVGWVMNFVQINWVFLVFIGVCGVVILVVFWILICFDWCMVMCVLVD